MQRPGVARVLAGLSVASLSPATARACPFRNSNTAQQVRAGIFYSELTYYLGVTVAPFIVLLAVLILILYWPISRSGKSRPLRQFRVSSDPHKF